ncbi:MAG: 50S ribosomal protein L30 [Clostridia bacterium]|jgi:large subunit ribosomal protein L30|nr:50S ribosomal protein L30 [Clostridia bacterium]
MEQIKIILAKSLICAKPNQKATAASLGLKKVGDSIVLNKDKSVEGKIVVLKHLVKVETI